MARPAHALIAGAGIGGLTAALSLARIGYRVSLIERSKSLQEVGAGLQISPNATAVLRELGLLPALADAAVAPRAIHVRRARDGATLTLLPLGQAQARWGAPYLLVHRGDLQRVLAEAVAKVPEIELVTDSNVTGLATTETGVALTALQGAIRVEYRGDCLIGADGVRSVVRECLGYDATRPPKRAHRIAFRALADPERVAAAMRLAESTLWLGPNAHVVHYPLRGGSVINVVAVVDEMVPLDWTAEFWSQPAAADEVAARFSGFDGRVRDLLAVAGKWLRWPLTERPALAHWTKGPITLLGDAAHPMLPFLAQGAAQAIEDAAALAGALAAADSVGQGLAAYEKARLPRARRVQAQSHRQASIYHLSGTAAFARDLAMRWLGPARLLDRYEWLYRLRAPDGLSARQ
ncbi:MAG: FAD-dependent monooxygenase [Beijerinckiaceae bacterium]